MATQKTKVSLLERLSTAQRSILFLRMSIVCLRSNPIAPVASFESHFVLLLSFFSFSRPSAHFCLHDLSRNLTNFWRGSMIPLTTYFFAVCLLSSRDPLFSPFLPLLMCATADRILANIVSLDEPHLRHRRLQANCFHNVSPWSFHVPFLCCCRAGESSLLFFDAPALLPLASCSDLLVCSSVLVHHEDSPC